MKKKKSHSQKPKAAEILQPKKPNISDSDLNMLYRCGQQYYYRRKEGRKVPPGIAQIVGRATHESVHLDLQTKIDTGQLRGAEEIADMARDEINGAWQAGIRLMPDELKEGQKKLKGEAVDLAVALSTLHHDNLAPIIKPVKVERFFRLDLEGYPMDLVGRIDIEEPDAIRDTKTAGKSPQEDEAHMSDQLTIYALGVKATTGKLPEKLYLDHLIKTKTPKVVTQSTERTEADFKRIFRLIERGIEVIDKEVFMPNPSGWWCSDRFCGYWADICEFGRRKAVSIAVKEKLIGKK